MARNWKKIDVTAQDVLDAAKTLGPGREYWRCDIVPAWVAADTYLSWAKTALGMGSSLGYDAAVCYAKRAVCRLIDSLMHHNHLRRWVGATYPLKIEMLKKIGIDIKSVVYDLIIDSRNDIEHSYSGATERQARHAVDLAEIAVPPLVAEAAIWSIVTLGFNYGGTFRSADPDTEPGTSLWNYDHDADVPFLLVDYADPIPRVMLIHRKDEEIRFAPLERFERDEAVELAKQLKEQQSGRTVQTSGPELISRLKVRLDFAF